MENCNEDNFRHICDVFFTNDVAHNIQQKVLLKDYIMCFDKSYSMWHCKSNLCGLLIVLQSTVKPEYGHQAEELLAR